MERSQERKGDLGSGGTTLAMPVEPAAAIYGSKLLAREHCKGEGH
jgi:hypothetical protein